MEVKEFFNQRLMGAYALKNASVIDKPFGALENSVGQLIRGLKPYRGQVPLATDPVPDTIATPADIITYGAGLTVNDRIIPVRFRPTAQNNSVQKNVEIVGYLCTQRFSLNQVSAPYTLSIRHYVQEGPGPVFYNNMDRDIIIEPTGGANSTCEFLVLCVQPTQQINYDSAAQFFIDAVSQRLGYAVPIAFAYGSDPINAALGLVTTAALIFKGQAAISQTITASPIIAHHDSQKTVFDLLASTVKPLNR